MPESLDQNSTGDDWLEATLTERRKFCAGRVKLTGAAKEIEVSILCVALTILMGTGRKTLRRMKLTDALGLLVHHKPTGRR
jgi:hypothetical protein